MCTTLSNRDNTGPATLCCTQPKLGKATQFHFIYGLHNVHVSFLWVENENEWGKKGIKVACQPCVICHRFYPYGLTGCKVEPCLPLKVAGGNSFVPSPSTRALHQQNVLFLAGPRLIVQPSIYKYVNMSGTRHNTARLYTLRRGGEEVSTPTTTTTSKIVFLDGFNEYRMFIVTIPCDSHKRLEKSTSTLPPHYCTLPTLPSLPQSLKALLKKKG